MPQSSHREQRPRSARTYVAVVVYLLCFTVLLIVISKMYLLPAMEASRDATPQEKRQLAAFARLMLAVVLFVLFAGLLIAFRIGRFFIPRAVAGRKKTEYVDAWAESGRRMQTPAKPE
jgi:peptidoglycan biosynthesis protein MviN/MurJ (putative lipid II flippase)